MVAAPVGTRDQNLPRSSTFGGRGWPAPSGRGLVCASVSGRNRRARLPKAPTPQARSNCGLTEFRPTLVRFHAARVAAERPVSEGRRKAERAWLRTGRLPRGDRVHGAALPASPACAPRSRPALHCCAQSSRSPRRLPGRSQWDVRATAPGSSLPDPLLSLESHPNLRAVGHRNTDPWLRVANNVTAGHGPGLGRPQGSSARRRRLCCHLSWVKSPVRSPHVPSPHLCTSPQTRPACGQSPPATDIHCLSLLVASRLADPAPAPYTFGGSPAGRPFSDTAPVGHVALLAPPESSDWQLLQRPPTHSSFLCSDSRGTGGLCPTVVDGRRGSELKDSGGPAGH